MITKLEDFLRRRSKISQVVRDDDVRLQRRSRRKCARSSSATRPRPSWREYLDTHPTPDRSAAPTADA